jgi:hypothetical protein
MLNTKKWSLPGFCLIVLSFGIWFTAHPHFNSVTWLPLEKPFRLQGGAEFREPFYVNLSERFFVMLALNKETPSDAENEELRCDIHAEIVRDGAKVWESTVESLKPGSFTNTDVYYNLGWVDLNPGSYQLIVISRAAPTTLEGRNPRIEVQLTEAAMEGGMFTEVIVTLLCLFGVNG